MFYIQSTEILSLLCHFFSFPLYTVVAGSPLLYRYNLLLLSLGTAASNMICLYLGAAVAVNVVLSFALGRVTVNSYIYWSLDRGCKGWEGSRDYLYWRLGYQVKR